jgi:heme A synthase
MKTLKTLAFTSAGFAYALIVLGALVRITGSGMGCGDDWPLCNGRLIPALDDFQTVLEWNHRMVALALSVLVAATAVTGYRSRSEPGGNSAMRPAILALVLLVLQVVLGAITVALELPPASVILHLAVAMALVAALLVTGLRATEGIFPDAPVLRRGSIIGATVLAAVVLLFGGLTSNMGAGPSCQGFPLCNGQVWPASGGGGLPHIHWTHRLVAYALFLHMLGIGIGLRKRQLA